MNERRETLYIIFGCVNIGIAVLISIGTLFSSLGFAFIFGLLIDLPLAIGLIGIWRFPRTSTIFMICGCAMILVYIGNWFLTDFRIGFRPVPFHVAWFGLNLAQILLAALRLRQLRKISEVTPCPQ
jgi:hypothetical protein